MSRAIRLGIFIVATLFLFAAGIFWIGRLQTRFRSTYRITAEFENVAGLDAGAEVRVGGIHEGTVREILLPQHSNEKVRVVMDLQKPTRAVIKKDSIAAIQSEGLVGDRYVEISFGSANAPSVNNDDTIQSEAPLQIADILKKTDAILDSAQGAMQNLSETTDNLASITSKVNQGHGTIGALVNNKDVYRRTDAAVASLQEDMEALKHNVLLRGFFSKRGYEDSADLKKYELPRMPDAQPMKKYDFEARKLFDKPDTAKLKKGLELDDAGKYLQENQFGLAVIAARSGMLGDSDKDQKLSEARAFIVREYLVDHFKLQDEHIKTVAIGKQPDAGPAGRIDILVYPPGLENPGGAKR